MNGGDRWQRMISTIDRSLSRVDPVAAACEGVRRALGTAGCSILVRSASGLLTMSGSDEFSSIADEVQVVMGEGPVVAADTSDLPVLLPDVSRPDDRWLVVAPSLSDCGVGGMMALPLRSGRARFGVLTSYWRTPVVISAEMYADGLVLADIVTELLVRHLAGESIEFEQSLGSLGSPIVQQSVGILAERYGVEVAEAQVRLRAMAFRRGSTVVELAQRIVNREVIEEQDS